MNRHERKAVIYTYQSRSYIEGVVEHFNNQWVFFNLESEEVSLLDEYVNNQIEVFRQNRWNKGTLLENGIITFANNKTDSVKDYDHIRLQKELLHAFDTLLKKLDDDVFFQFVTTLNALNFSIYDCIFCYNQLMFLTNKDHQTGVNFIFFDNEEETCAIQHHFSYNQETNERFEFTLNTGKRIMLEKR